METKETGTNKKQKFIFENGELKADIFEALREEKTGKEKKTRNLDDYETEKLSYLTVEIENVTKILEEIKENIKKANQYGIKIKKDFDFSNIYHTFFDRSENSPVDWKEFYKMISEYNENIKNAIKKYEIFMGKK